MRVLTKGRTAEDKRNYYKEYMRERRKMFKDKGVCIQCGKPALKDHTLCKDCSMKQCTATNKYHNKTVLAKAKEKKPMIEIISVRDMTPEEKAEYAKTHPVENIKKLDRLPIEIVSVRDLAD